MDILWPAILISIVVGFVFFVLAGHWRGVLRQQSQSIRRLSDRVQLLEEVDNPRFRELINESAPAPLEQVFTFSFRLNDRFWRDTLQLSERDWSFVRSFSSFVGSVKLERWRSHAVATITEVLPESKTAAWHTRTLDYYPGPAGRNERLALWELLLSRPVSPEKTSSIELALQGNALELSFRGVPVREGHADGEDATSAEDPTFFRVPLDPRLLAEFRSHDPAEPENGNGHSNGNGAGAWRAFYSWEDERLGVEWQLRVVDLNLKTEWDRWKILESAASR